MKNIFDFNIHLPYSFIQASGQLAYNEDEITVEQLNKSYIDSLENLQSSISSANFMFLNENIITEDGIDTVIKRMKGDFKHCCITSLINFRNSKIEDSIDRAVELGIDGIKFHSYIQKITENDFDNVLKAAHCAEKHKLFICIDTSYGTSGMYKYDNLRLSAFLSEFISKVPIVLLHSAGARILEAMLLAEDKKNIFLETSFSLPYFLGSSVEQDFAFAYKKIGVDRILYGSDFPYISLMDSVHIMNDFFEKYGFDDADIQKIMVQNVFRLKNE
jgi:uncharacterized protein